MFFYQQDREKKQKEKELHDMIRRFCNTIQTDITTIKNAISGDKYPKKKIENKNIEYTNVLLSTKVQESLIYSGLFSHFESETQTNLDELYYKIEHNNDNLARLADVIISKSKFPQSNLQDVVDNFEKLITDYEQEIKEYLSKVENSINMNYKKSSHSFQNEMDRYCRKVM